MITIVRVRYIWDKGKVKFWLWLYYSSILTLSTRAPQGCVLRPLLYSLYTHDCTPVHNSNAIIKFADDSTWLGWYHMEMSLTLRTERRLLNSQNGESVTTWQRGWPPLHFSAQTSLRTLHGLLTLYIISHPEGISAAVFSKGTEKKQPVPEAACFLLPLLSWKHNLTHGILVWYAGCMQNQTVNW